MTTEEKIAELDEASAFAMEILGQHAKPAEVIGHETAVAVAALTCQVQALRLMLREEIREAAWRLAGDSAVAKFHHLPYDQDDDPIASRKAPDG